MISGGIITKNGVSQTEREVVEYDYIPIIDTAEVSRSDEYANDEKKDEGYSFE